MAVTILAITMWAAPSNPDNDLATPIPRQVCLLAMPDLRRNREEMREPGHTRAKEACIFWTTIPFCSSRLYRRPALGKTSRWCKGIRSVYRRPKEKSYQETDLNARARQKMVSRCHGRSVRVR
jgi:hypothetical protein